MTDLRFEAHATISPGEHEHRVDGSALQLVRLVLCDEGEVGAPDGTTLHRPDVVCPLRPAEARQLAEQLLALAARAEGTVPR